MREVAGGKTPGDPTIIAGWAKSYLAEHAVRNRRSTTSDVEWTIGYVVEAIGDVKLTKLRPADIRRVHERHHAVYLRPVPLPGQTYILVR